MSWSEELFAFLKYLRYMVISFLVLFFIVIVFVMVLCGYARRFIFSLDSYVDVEVITGTVLAPFIALLNLALFFTFVFYVPVGTVISLWYVWPALENPGEKRLAIAYSIAINLVALASIPLTLYFTFPIFINIGVVFSELLGIEPVITINSLVQTLCYGYLLNIMVFLTPIILDAVVRFNFFGLRNTILKSKARDRAIFYVVMYWVFALITPGDIIIATLLYTGVFIALIETVLAIHRRKTK